MKRLLLIAMIAPLLTMAQTESHNFKTRDTVIQYPANQWANVAFTVRLTTSVDDPSPRPTILFMPGRSEQGTATAKLAVYGPHYWLTKGWDGSVKLGNGMHYPNIISIINPDPNTPPAVGLVYVINVLKKLYPQINPKAIHGTGLSFGGYTISKAITIPDESGMQVFKSIAPLSGTDNFSPPGYPAFGHWARKYGGKFFGTVGYADGQVEYPPAKAMNDSVPGSAYFAYVTLASGTHGGWNDIYNPSNTNWSAVGQLGTYITKSSSPNLQGTYVPGSSLFQWMLRQGDTSLVGAAPVVVPPPVVNQAPVVSILPVPAVSASSPWALLDGSASYDPDGTIDSTSFTLVSGPSAVKIISSSCGLTAGVIGLIPGTYVFKLTAWDMQGLSSQALASVVVNPAPVTVLFTKQIPIVVAGISVGSLTLTANSDGSYSLK